MVGPRPMHLWWIPTRALGVRSELEDGDHEQAVRALRTELPNATAASVVDRAGASVRVADVLVDDLHRRADTEHGMPRTAPGEPKRRVGENFAATCGKARFQAR